MGENVAADAQFGLAHILKPEDNFENLFQGQRATTNPDVVPIQASRPIPFFEWKDGQPPNPRDRLATEDGFNENLLNFIRVPWGAMIKLKIPGLVTVQPGNPPVILPVPYRYMVLFRDRSLAQYRQTQTGPYHNRAERLGAPDTSGVIGTPGPRFTVPCSTRTLLFNRPQTTNPALGATSDLRKEFINVFPGGGPNLPLIGASSGFPAGIGVYQQGVVDPAFDLFSGYGAIYEEFVFESSGDEMLIVADRECDIPEPGADCTDALWNFQQGQLDQGFSNLYGRNSLGDHPHPNFGNAGILLYTGSAP